MEILPCPCCKGSAASQKRSSFFFLPLTWVCYFLHTIPLFLTICNSHLVELFNYFMINQKSCWSQHILVFYMHWFDCCICNCISADSILYWRHWCAQDLRSILSVCYIVTSSMCKDLHPSLRFASMPNNLLCHALRSPVSLAPRPHKRELQAWPHLTCPNLVSDIQPSIWPMNIVLYSLFLGVALGSCSLSKDSGEEIFSTGCLIVVNNIQHCNLLADLL